jgi:hypothetical protein
MFKEIFVHRLNRCGPAPRTSIEDEPSDQAAVDCTTKLSETMQWRISPNFQVNFYMCSAIT